MTDQLWFYQVLDDIETLLTANWGAGSGTVPDIKNRWEEKLLTYNSTDSYILLSTTTEASKIFSHLEADGTYRWLHNVPVDIDVRVWTKDTTQLKTRFSQVFNRVTDLLKNNIRLIVGATVYVRIKLLSVTPDFTRRNTMRLVLHIEVEKVE